jgi:hypothetical protein
MTLGFYLTPVRMAISRKQTTINAGDDIQGGEEGVLIHCWVGM